MVASDRISTYDVVHPTPIPDKGAVLTGLSVFWLTARATSSPTTSFPPPRTCPTRLRGRALTVRKLEMVPVECVVRGYITGVGLEGLPGVRRRVRDRAARRPRESERLPERSSRRRPRLRRATTTENIDFESAVAATGDRATVELLRDVSIALYERAAEHAREHGIILADTKFEFGRDVDGTLTLGDEVLTPTPPASGRRGLPVGQPQPSFDKQYVRDWASGTGWTRPSPRLRFPTMSLVRRARSTSTRTS